VVKEYLLSFNKKRLEQTGAKGSRKKTSNKWFETQDTIAYYEEFARPKIIFSEIVSKPQFHYDTEDYYLDNTAFLITGKKLKYLIALLNSSPITYFFKRFYAGGNLVGKYRYKKAFMKRLPIPAATAAQQAEIETLVTQILAAKRTLSGPSADVSALEAEIDQRVYQLYGLTAEEIAIVEEAVK